VHEIPYFFPFLGTILACLDPDVKDVCCGQVHKVIAGSLADRDGRIQKGDRVLSINGRSTKGVSHREALSILKVGFLYIFKNTSLNCK
jgi:hypothetical protein